jgi:hypothetical protein
VIASSRSMRKSDDPAILVIEGDITRPETAERILDIAAERFGRIDTLVNNAGVFIAKPFTEYSEKDFATAASSISHRPTAIAAPAERRSTSPASMPTRCCCKPPIVSVIASRNCLAKQSRPPMSCRCGRKCREVLRPRDYPQHRAHEARVSRSGPALDATFISERQRPMHDNIVSAAPETSANPPPDYLDIDAAVELIARRANPKLTIVYRGEADAAWRTLCKIAPVVARIITGEGLYEKPAPAQFEGFAGKYWKFASVLRYPPNDVRVPEEIEEINPSYAIRDESGRVHRDARLVFLKGEIDSAWWAIMEPKNQVEVIAKWLRGKYRSRKAAKRGEMLRSFIADGGHGSASPRSMDRARAMAWPKTGEGSG